ncbi:growth hormone secretagogue receptor type 1 isoform X2 [Cephus cinctus]|uniref:Growth hormone secretagogue receptor type 1 isoform X2 n=1 Tax=Cephus cinctus TaxID=211228 RepID=A0AAJ7RSG7_CEPCN|nr:growth hormone secretagogue receptor type 1 isoform X2 [Cephus cinctus]
MLSTMSAVALELNSSYYTTVAGSSSADDFSVSTTDSANSTSASYMLPAYIRITSMVACIVVMVLGVVGNLMVPLVVLRGKDMRNSTNIFLVNLSVADLCVLLVCAPTLLVEVNSLPEVWRLGEHMCKAVPFVEMTVAHASVLTILAISFERYYAICEPLRAGYVCTKARATWLCLLAWAAAALCTSPIIWITQYEEYWTNNTNYLETQGNSTVVPTCLAEVKTLATMSFFLILVFFFFFFLPLLILLVLYSIIVRHLVRDSATASTSESQHIRSRRQVVMMLLTVVFSFFICLTPFHMLTLYVVLIPADKVTRHSEAYYNVLYFSRIMFYLNSAVNPILYNLMSTRFRIGFLRLCGFARRRGHDRGTFRSTLTSTRISRRMTRKDQQEIFL